MDHFEHRSAQTVASPAHLTNESSDIARHTFYVPEIAGFADDNATFAPVPEVPIGPGTPVIERYERTNVGIPTLCGSKATLGISVTFCFIYTQLKKKQRSSAISSIKRYTYGLEMFRVRML